MNLLFVKSSSHSIKTLQSFRTCCLLLLALISFSPQLPPGVSALCRVSPVALACTWVLHVLSIQKPLDRTAPRRSWSKDVMGMFCWMTQLGCLAYPYLRKWGGCFYSLPCWHLMRIFTALVQRGGHCSEGFLTWAEQAVLVRLLGAVSGWRNRREKHLPFVKNAM